LAAEERGSDSGSGHLDRHQENPDATLSEWAATIVCIVEALTPLPDGIRFEMLLTEDFEDALDLAVGYVERTGLVADLERNLEACF
jgi:hypothetical protein